MNATGSVQNNVDSKRHCIKRTVPTIYWDSFSETYNMYVMLQDPQSVHMIVVVSLNLTTVQIRKYTENVNT